MSQTLTLHSYAHLMFPTSTVGVLNVKIRMVEESVSNPRSYYRKGGWVTKILFEESMGCVTTITSEYLIIS